MMRSCWLQLPERETMAPMSRPGLIPAGWRRAQIRLCPWAFERSFLKESSPGTKALPGTPVLGQSRPCNPGGPGHRGGLTHAGDISVRAEGR